ncbi:Crp/Fnr family transcriptional regulator [Aureimonas glaciei]|uniref:Cyclic nucleotide-binding protein n=1 Tax=Aureimonas glaciei TaxID=1776957 RepID=A0A917DBD2_9HYPH|nr:Crp/Fnr family transcriptional regulator [Aureimonas glaciei]GGD22681.1 cyclic nucleotide-binding protein [Aureimonas glaciei]
MTPLISQQSVRNRLLRSLSPGDFALLAPNLVSVELPLRWMVEEQGETIQFVNFFESGIGSSIVSGSNEERAEAGHIGWEGMSGRAVVLGSTNSIGSVIMQVAGSSLQITAARLTDVMRESITVRELLNLFVLANEVQVAHTLLAATRFSVGQRLARWLLMYHDRIDGEDLPVTHELLSLMLGVRRPGVTDAIHVMEGDHAIRTHRGMVQILDRPLLVVMAGGCYGIPEREYERLIPLALSRSCSPDPVEPGKKRSLHVV